MCLTKHWEKNKKKIDCLDMGLIKTTIVFLTLFVITTWPVAMTWVQSVKPLNFLIITLLLVARPFYRYFIK